MRLNREWLGSVRTWLAGKPRLLAVSIVLMALVLVVGVGRHPVVRLRPDGRAAVRGQVKGLGEMAQATTIFDANDAPAFTIFKEQRIEVPLEKMSPNLIKAVVSVEDQRFYDHSGVDVIRIGRRRRAQPPGAAAAPRGAAPSPSSSPGRASSAATRPIAAS